MIQKFLEFSLKNRTRFLNILSDVKESNMEFICLKQIDIYLKNIYEKYLLFLDELLLEYNTTYNLNILKESIICDFITSMEPQILDSSSYEKNEYCTHICCIEYNMIINIHKYSYELFIINHDINEKDFFHGDSLTYLLEKNEITIDKFRSESYYDIDNFNHINIKNDLDYLMNTTMIDIYILTILSDVLELYEYEDVFSIVYNLNSKKLISKDLFRYIITMEDSIKMKKNNYKSYLSIFFIITGILLVAIFIASKKI